jgi:ankyrin repeat protein
LLLAVQQIDNNLYPFWLQLILAAIQIGGIISYDRWRPEKYIMKLIADNNIQGVRQLIQQRLWQANIIDMEGYTPLHQACTAASDEMVLLLLELGADPNSISNDKGTPVHWAVSKNSLIKLGYLIEYGASLDIQDYMGKTPLHWAVHFNSLPTVTFLVEHGADLAICDEKDKTPLELCRNKSEWVDIFNYLNSQN